MNVYGQSDIGKVRSTNQDRFLAMNLEDGAVLAAVCDGMGGPGGGQIASDITVKTLEEILGAEYQPELPSSALPDLVNKALQQANIRVYEKAKEDSELLGMGTTVVLALVRPQETLFANIGDSRAYVIQEGMIHQVTKDHSIVQQMLDNGKISKFEAQNHPQKNIITRALGVDKTTRADYFSANLAPGDMILLCSDGLTGHVDEHELALELSLAENMEATVDKLIDLANERGGRDNITAVAVKL